MEIENINNDSRIEDILDAFRIYDGFYKKEHVDGAIELQAEITPYLIKILQTVLDDPNEYIENKDLYDHIYAVMLLGHLKKPNAHKLIIDIFSLPNDLPDQLFGDICTANLPTILFNTCGGSTDHIRSMILNKEVDDFCRISACHALAYGVIKGYLPRKEVVEFFGTLFTGDETDETSGFWGLLASIACDLCPIEIIDVIQDAFENGLIMPGVIGYEHFERALDMGEKYCLEKAESDFEYKSLEDLHGAMSWWGCFDQGYKNIPDNNFLQTAKKTKKEKASSKKKKRKQANISRKKNRKQ
ncbi:MAG: DUF1186 domain-containing protein [Desulfobacula sp.]|jgi:hypothetical protein|nr:DUF1186 domain-containing protein [Desulfobacula sp.]